MGYCNPDYFRGESSFDGLRSRDEFRLLMLDLAFPADPFAGAPESPAGVSVRSDCAIRYGSRTPAPNP